MATSEEFVVRPAGWVRLRPGVRLRVVVSAVTTLACTAALTAVAAFTPLAPAAKAAAAALPSNTQRIFGADRIHTALATSFDEFAAAGSANAVVLARSDDFPDALAGGPLAAKVGGPLLLTPPDALDPAVGAEIIRVAAKGSTVYVLGGVNAIGTGVTNAIAALGDVPVRVSGADRYATAVAIAGQLGNPTTVFEATGLRFADALAAGPAAIANNAAILLTDGTNQADATAAYLAAHKGGARYALGGPAAAADPGAQAFIGSDRYDTAAQVADQFFPAPTAIGVATGTDFPDALAAGPLLAARGAPLLLVPPAGALPSAPTIELLLDTASAGNAIVFGGTAAVSDDVATQVGVLAGAGPAARNASSAPAWSARYGVREDNYTAASNGTTPFTTKHRYIVDGTAGTATESVVGASPPVISSVPTPSRAEFAAISLDPATLPQAVNLVYAKLDLELGISSSDSNELFVRNGEQVLLNPVAAPSLRLAVFAALAGLDTAEVTSGVKDSSGRSGIEISFALSSSKVTYIFEPATFVPLEDTEYTLSGVLETRRTVMSMTTVSTAPAA